MIHVCSSSRTYREALDGTTRCLDCGEPAAKKEKRMRRPRSFKATRPTRGKVIACGMCGEKHPAGAECKLGDWVRHKARQLREGRAAREAAIPKRLSETGSMGRFLRQLEAGRETRRALQEPPPAVTPEQRAEEEREERKREELIGVILNSTFGAVLTEDDLRSLPTERLEEMAASARKEADEVKAARAAGYPDYVPPPDGISIALAKRAAGGGAR